MPTDKAQLLMTLPVHLVPTLSGIKAGSTLQLEGDEAHHAVVVRRLRVGEDLVFTDGRGTEARAVVKATGKRTLDALVTAVSTTPALEPSITVVQALPKGDRGELAVEVLTEIGVARIVPWAASRSVAVWRGDRANRSVGRWRSTAREAAKQSRRAWFPEVDELTDTPEVVELLRAAGVAVVLHEDAAGCLGQVELASCRDIVVVVGPEGGLTQEEVAAFVEAGAVAVKLGAEVLRTSTAGLAAVSALLSRTSRWA